MVITKIFNCNIQILLWFKLMVKEYYIKNNI